MASSPECSSGFEYQQQLNKLHIVPNLLLQVLSQVKNRSLLNAARLGALSVLVGGVAVGAGSQPIGFKQASAPTPEVTASTSAIPIAITTPVPTPVNAIGPQQIEEAERMLSNLGYWTGPIDSTFDGASQHAMMAFTKVQGMPRGTDLTLDRYNALLTAKRPSPQKGSHRHVEIDMDKQVLFFVDGGRVQHILPVSTGNGKAFVSEGWARRAVTPRGTFTVSRKISGWRTSPLGQLYYPSYFNGGIAVHGAPSVPAGPASHGCVRIPMFAAVRMFGLMSSGTQVVVFGNQAIVGGFPEGVPLAPPGPPPAPTAPPESDDGPAIPPEIEEPRQPRTPTPPDSGENEEEHSQGTEP